MKKILYSIILSLFVLFPIEVLSEGYISISPSNITIEQGDSQKINISAYNVIGDITIKSNNSSIASINSSKWETGMVNEKQSISDYIIINGVNIGTTTITFVIDAATFDGEELSGQTKIINVNVVPKTIQNNQTTVPKTQKSNIQNNLSNNNNIKSISIEGYELVKLDNNNYTLSVNNDVASINVNAIAEDAKSKVTGTGTHELQVGENNIEVIVTSESGLQNKFNVKVTRKDGYYLEDLDYILKKSELKEIDIKINDNSIISKEEITKIKESKKIIRLNYYDNNKKLLYSWILNGKEIKDTKELTTSITYTSENYKEIYKLSNYADGLYINFKHNDSLPTGTKIKLYVGDKFENGNILNIYQYNNSSKSLDFTHNNLTVTEGYIELSIEHCYEYFMTMSNIGVLKKENSSVNIFMIFTIIEIIIIMGLVIFIFTKLKPNKKENSDIEISKSLENSNNNTFNRVESNQKIGASNY